MDRGPFLADWGIFINWRNLVLAGSRESASVAKGTRSMSGGIRHGILPRAIHTFEHVRRHAEVTKQFT
jgi:hypothetical protein